MQDPSSSDASAQRGRPDMAGMDFNTAPMLVFYEVTQACDLVCRHCRASARPKPHADQLTPTQSLALIDELASFPRKPLLVFTGGDCFKRDDLEDLIRHAKGLGMTVAVTPSSTPLVTRERLQSIKAAGTDRLAVSIDGPDAETHDWFRGWSGSFEMAKRILREAQEEGLEVQVNTTLTSFNIEQLEKMAEVMRETGIVLWSLFFLIPVGRGMQRQMISPEQCEEVYGRIHTLAKKMPYAIKTTEAPQYRRYLVRLAEKSGENLRSMAGGMPLPRSAHGQGVNDGRGVMFVSHKGEICPSGFLPEVCGRYPADSPVDVYQKHPLFVALRDATGYKGKCGLCEYQNVCGGSRARAYAMTGDPLETDPMCQYLPAALR